MGGVTPPMFRQIVGRMPNPHRGDVLIPVSGITFELVDVATQKFVAGPFDSLVTASAAARERKAPAIWQQNVDARGRPLGDPFANSRPHFADA